MASRNEPIDPEKVKELNAFYNLMDQLQKDEKELRAKLGDEKGDKDTYDTNLDVLRAINETLKTLKEQKAALISKLVS
jgi:hypothetical protein